jgi:endonuclease/exonuclease/phosphatase family metal-dependent hydrolase
MISIMSFNIRYGTAPDGPHRWQRRKKMVIERIRTFSPDLLGLQECRNDDQAAYIKSKLPDYLMIGFERGGSGEAAIEMAPVLIRRSSFEVEESGCFWLSETPAVSGSLGWGADLPRTVTWAKLKSRLASGPSLYFFNTHFDHASAQAQVESARLLNGFFADRVKDQPLILCGDFNIEKDSIPYRTLLDGGSPGLLGLHDPYRAAHPAPWEEEGTFHGFGTLEKPTAIDWLLASTHFRMVEAIIDRYQDGGRYPADHYPLECTFNG